METMGNLRQKVCIWSLRCKPTFIGRSYAHRDIKDGDGGVLFEAFFFLLIGGCRFSLASPT